MKIYSRFFKNISLVCLVIFCITLSNCKSGTQAKNKSETSAKSVVYSDTLIKGNFKEASGIVFDSSAIDLFLNQFPSFKEFAPDYKSFYALRQFNYVWFDKQGLVETAHILVTNLESMDSEGLNAQIPYKDSLNFYLQQTETSEEKMQDVDLKIELLLTGEYFAYAKKVIAGAEADKASSIGWFLPRKKLSYSNLLDENISGKTFEKIENESLSSQYIGLKKALQQFQQIAQSNTEKMVPSISGKKPLRIADTSVIVTAVRQKLQWLGYTKENNNSDNKYEPALAVAINAFKTTHGLKADSVISNEVIAKLNIPIKKRIETIIVNMERFRWVPAKMKSDEFIFVNIPAYQLIYFENNKKVWDCNVVVGTPMNKTVIFSGDLKFVVFSPYWNVPQSIINKEVIPGMRRNKNYLASHRMEWNGGKVRQLPGPANSLGLVKFLFPNSNNIYLHDTPSKSLFSKDDRAFSHGCIRVAKPRDLAIRILKQDTTWTDEKIDEAMHSGKEKYVTLTKTIPVYIGYFTAFVDGEGRVNFRNDVYNRDGRLLEMLEDSK